MPEVNFDLQHFSTLGGMVPEELANGQFGQAQLPANMNGAHVYIILNINDIPHNRYIGISSDIEQRFNTRLATVVEMGFSQTIMDNIGVWWGTAWYRDNPQQQWVPIAPQPQQPLTHQINGHTVNLEQLLIRFVMTKLQPQDHNTVSNTLLNSPYTNLTGVPIQVTLSCVAAPQFQLPVHNQPENWAVNQVW